MVEGRKIDSHLMPDDECRQNDPESQQEDQRLPDELSAEHGAGLHGLELGGG
jgi:hypothetical protein